MAAIAVRKQAQFANALACLLETRSNLAEALDVYAKTSLYPDLVDLARETRRAVEQNLEPAQWSRYGSQKMSPRLGAILLRRLDHRTLIVNLRQFAETASQLEDATPGRRTYWHLVVWVLLAIVTSGLALLIDSTYLYSILSSQIQTQLTLPRLIFLVWVALMAPLFVLERGDGLRRFLWDNLASALARRSFRFLVAPAGYRVAVRKHLRRKDFALSLGLGLASGEALVTCLQRIMNERDGDQAAWAQQLHRSLIKGTPLVEALQENDDLVPLRSVVASSDAPGDLAENLIAVGREPVTIGRMGASAKSAILTVAAVVTVGYCFFLLRFIATELGGGY